MAKKKAVGAITKVGDGVYLIGSDTSERTYTITFGAEGDFFSCTCPAYAIGRNRAGGLGSRFDCKHVTAVLEQADGITEREKAALVASLRSIEKGLREPGPDVDDDREPDQPVATADADDNQLSSW